MHLTINYKQIICIYIYIRELRTKRTSKGIFQSIPLGQTSKDVDKYREESPCQGYLHFTAVPCDHLLLGSTFLEKNMIQT